MKHFKFKCRVCSDGRLYAGGWCHESVIPNPLPPDEILLDDLSGITHGFYTDYLWDGETLTYSPAVQPDASPAAESTVQIKNDGTEVTYT